MKYERKCPLCDGRIAATKRIGKLNVCDTHYKYVRKHKLKMVWTEKLVGKLGDVSVHRDYLIKVY